MVRVLLITTGQNAVRNTLSAIEHIDLCVVDMRDYQSETKESFIKDLWKILQRSEAQVLVTWRCPFILPTEIFSVPEYGAYNLHPSLLPAYPGLNPWDEIFRNGEIVTGVTLHRMTTQADDGEIIYQQEFSILGAAYEEAREISDTVAGTMISGFMKIIDEIINIISDPQLQYDVERNNIECIE